MSSNPDLPIGAAGLEIEGNLTQVGGPGRKVPRLTVWMHRLSLVILVVFCIELGILLAVLPWTTVWTENSLLVAYPALGSVFGNEFVRGAITGLGLLDIWIGVWEAIHYTDPGKRKY